MKDHLTSLIRLRLTPAGLCQTSAGGIRHITDPRAEAQGGVVHHDWLPIDAILGGPKAEPMVWLTQPTLPQ